MKTIPTQQELKEVFLYNPEGYLVWKKSGKRAGSLMQHGSRTRYVVKLHGKTYLGHRLIYALVRGDFDQTLQIDHLDHDTMHNRIENMRLATRFENMRNRRLAKNNLSGRIGVFYSKASSRWVARIGTGTYLKKQIHLGEFKTFEEACAARAASEVLLEYHQNHGALFTAASQAQKAADFIHPA